MENLTNCVVIEHQKAYLHWPRFKKMIEQICQLNLDTENHLVRLEEFELYSVVFSSSEEERAVNSDYRNLAEAIRFLKLLPPQVEIAFEGLKDYILKVLELELDILESLTQSTEALTSIIKHQEALDTMAYKNMDSISYAIHLQKKTHSTRLLLKRTHEVSMKHLLKQQLANNFKSL